MEPKHAGGGCSVLTLPQGVPLEFEVLVKSHRRASSFPFREKLEAAEVRRVLGNQRFNSTDYYGAISKYQAAFRMFRGVPEEKASDPFLLNIQISLWNNLALCYLKTGRAEEAIEACNEVLKRIPSHEKALLRRGQAHNLLGNYDEAKQDLQQAASSSSSSLANSARQMLKRLEAQGLRRQREEQKLYSRMLRS